MQLGFHIDIKHPMLEIYLSRLSVRIGRHYWFEGQKLSGGHFAEWISNNPHEVE